MNELSRRELLTLGAAGMTSLLAVSAFGAAKAKAPEVEPNEDLMREHGALRRMLLIYEEVARRTAAGRPPLAQLAATSSLIKRFVEDYHEKLEENYVFPTFEKAKKLTDLTSVLRRQHAAGRKLTEQLHALASARTADAAARRDIVSPPRLVRPHVPAPRRARGHRPLPAIPPRGRRRAVSGIRRHVRGQRTPTLRPRRLRRNREPGRGDREAVGDLRLGAVHAAASGKVIFAPPVHVLAIFATENLHIHPRYSVRAKHDSRPRGSTCSDGGFASRW